MTQSIKKEDKTKSHIKYLLGYPDGTFKPERYITRAETAVIFNKLFDRKVDEASLSNFLKNPQNITKFKDLGKEHWAYYDLVEATNTHDYVRRFKDRSANIVEDWIEIK